MPRVTLIATYGYRNPNTGVRTYYGPGVGIEVPQGMVEALGLTAWPEETEAAQPAPLPDPLPADFPGRKYLVRAGLDSLTAVRGLSIDDLINLSGIGTRLAEAITERIKDA